MRTEPGLYDFWPYINRPKIEWPDGKKVAFMVAPNIEFYELNPPANPSRKSWPRPYPDITPVSYRDHGNRVGHWRLMEMMDEFNVRGSVSLSVAMCQHHPEILEATVERKWDFFYAKKLLVHFTSSLESLVVLDCLYFHVCYVG